MWALLLVGCDDPGDDGNGAIEITGYLDAARVTFTRYGDEVAAVGRDGAASVGSLVQLEDLATGEVAEATVASEGVFVVSVAAADGDELALEVADASPADRVTTEVSAFDPFPAYATVTATVDPHDPASVLVEVGFAPARADGHVWATSADGGDVAVLSVVDGGHLQSGHVAGSDGDVLHLHWVPVAGDPSAAIEVVAGP